MKPAALKMLAVYAAATLLVTAAVLLTGRQTPSHGAARFYYAQPGFAGPPIEEHGATIDLEFLDARPQFPRQQFSVRWRAVFLLDEDTPVEFFAGGNDEVELRVDGQLLVRRNVREGMRTLGRTVVLPAGVHSLEIDYQQFGGGMSLNIQRAIGGQPAAPFQRDELFARAAPRWQIELARGARRVRGMLPIIWLVGVFGAVAVAAPHAVSRWRSSAAPRSVREYLARARGAAAPAILGPAVVFVLGPHTIFSNNRAEFAVGFGELAVPWALRAAALNGALLFLAGCILALVSERLTRMYAALLLALGFALWGQGNLWNADYGVLAGQDIDFAQHAGRAAYEWAAWAAIALAALVFWRPVSRTAGLASMAFLAVQGAAGAVGAFQPAAARGVRWIEPPPQLYEFSGTRNVIHIVLDEFQADVFDEIFRRDRELFDRHFTGFRYFADHAGAFPTTSFSMPAMLSGREYRNEQLTPEFVRDAFRTSSIFQRLSTEGWDIDAASIVPIDSFEQWLGPESAPNWTGARFRIRKPFVSRDDYREVTARQLLELSVFRHVPHDVKVAGSQRPDVLYASLWMDRAESPAQIRRHEAANSVAFLDHFVNAMRTGRDRPVYKLIHVGVPHRPVVVDAECRFAGVVEMSRATYTEQSRCAVRLTAAFLDRLKALGIYDNSAIIVSSDHGTDLPPLGFGGASRSLALVPGPSTVRLPAIASTAKAVMLIKPRGAAGPVEVSDAPTSHVDLPATVLDMLGVASPSQDSSMLRRNPAAARTRVFGMYNPHIRFPKAYLDRIDVLTIDGRVVDGAAWNVRQLIWRPDVRLDDREIDVGPRTGHSYLGPGWSLERREEVDGQPVTYAQALTSEVRVSVSLPPATVDVVLRASGRAQSINIRVDGRDVGVAALPEGTGYRDVVLRVPADAARPAVSEIVLSFDGEPGFKLDRISVNAR